MGVSTVDDQVVTGAPVDLDLTNSELAAAVDKSLRCAAGIPRDSIRASVRAHAVTLTGDVEWKYQKELVGHMVSHIRGVRSVTNDIDVSSRIASSRARELISQIFTRSALHNAVRGQIVPKNDTVRPTPDRSSK
jgi:osmotically-inducible protein OsmY